MKKAQKAVDSLDPARTIAFSDGVVAIAITILILPLIAIELPTSADETSPLGYVWQQNSALITSFLVTWAVIVTFWMTHHRVFHNFQGINQAVFGWNILWVFAIIILPFPMNLLYQVENTNSILEADRQVVTFYIATMAVISFSMSMINRQARRNPELLTEEAGGRELGTASAIGWAFTIYLAALSVVAMFLPNVALIGLFGLWPLPKIVETIAERRQQSNTTEHLPS